MSDKVVDLPTPARGRGRPKGTGGNKRPDRTTAMSVQTEPGDNRKYLQHTMRMWNWPEVDMREPEQVAERIEQYFGICIEDDMKPSVAGLACAFGVDRKTIWAWANGVDSKTLPTESRNLIKKAYQNLNAQMENYMQNGKINPRCWYLPHEEQYGLCGQAGDGAYAQSAAWRSGVPGRLAEEVSGRHGWRL